jgi:hypothetical protein
MINTKPHHLILLDRKFKITESLFISIKGGSFELL